mmetsp:Transcript_3610/g.5963  ORF Transcript_3610/g.5963 Transcript_3610/m.5963 type:complete len:227 (+) Transcript_3610:511-1191(+)
MFTKVGQLTRSSSERFPAPQPASISFCRSSSSFFLASTAFPVSSATNWVFSRRLCNSAMKNSISFSFACLLANSWFIFASCAAFSFSFCNAASCIFWSCSSRSRIFFSSSDFEAASFSSLSNSAALTSFMCFWRSTSCMACSRSCRIFSARSCSSCFSLNKASFSAFSSLSFLRTASRSWARASLCFCSSSSLFTACSTSSLFASCVSANFLRCSSSSLCAASLSA